MFTVTVLSRSLSFLFTDGVETAQVGIDLTVNGRERVAGPGVTIKGKENRGTKVGSKGSGSKRGGTKRRITMSVRKTT